MAYANAKKKIKLKKKLEKQEDRVAKVMAKRDVKRLKKGKETSNLSDWERLGRGGPFAFKKKKLMKIQGKYQDEMRQEGYDEARKAGDPWSGGQRGREKYFDAEDESRIRLKKKKKAYRAKKGY
tara:strand:+ start:500 stop:871 length:372 start_codon:yes stop_codon:yes gene_type:complete